MSAVTEARAERKARLAALLKTHYTLHQVAVYLERPYSWAYELVVSRGELPYINFGHGGQRNPKYLVPIEAVHEYRREYRRKHKQGRPRVSETAQQHVGARRVSPGAIITRELAERGWPPERLAAHLNEPEEAVNTLIAGTLLLTGDMAHRLSLIFATSTDFWLDLENTYRSHKELVVDDDGEKT